MQHTNSDTQNNSLFGQNIDPKTFSLLNPNLLLPEKEKQSTDEKLCPFNPLRKKVWKPLIEFFRENPAFVLFPRKFNPSR